MKKFLLKDEDIFFEHDGEEFCVADIIVAELLNNEVLMCLGAQDQDGKSTIGIFLNCSDVFAWGCADCEPITQEDLPSLYRMCRADPKYGDIKWVCKKANLQPQRALADIMKAAGCWEPWMDELGKNNG